MVGSRPNPLGAQHRDDPRDAVPDMGAAMNRFKKEDIHPSHTIEESQTIVGERFATTYDCQLCGYTAYTTVAGADCDTALLEPCAFGDERVYVEFKLAQAKSSVIGWQKRLDALAPEGGNA